MKEIFCCGTGQRSPYCSMCGKKLQAYPLSDLLNHCREQAEKHMAKFKSLLARFGPALVARDDVFGRGLCVIMGIDLGGLPLRPGNPISTNRKEYLKARDEARKWLSYAGALERIMKHAATLPPDPEDGAGGQPNSPADVRNLEL